MLLSSEEYWYWFYYDVNSNSKLYYLLWWLGSEICVVLSAFHLLLSTRLLGISNTCTAQRPVKNFRGVYVMYIHMYLLIYLCIRIYFETPDLTSSLMNSSLSFQRLQGILTLKANKTISFCLSTDNWLSWECPQAKSHINTNLTHYAFLILSVDAYSLTELDHCLIFSNTCFIFLCFCPAFVIITYGKVSLIQGTPHFWKQNSTCLFDKQYKFFEDKHWSVFFQSPHRIH